MYFDARLPKNALEGILFGGIICFLTALFMCTLNTALGMGKFDGEVIVSSLTWFMLYAVIAFAFENLVMSRISNFMVKKFAGQTDGFNARTMFKIFFTVIGMSLFMTMVACLINRGFTVDALLGFVNMWPRNFAIVLFWELLIAQPIARGVMKLIHREKSSANAKTMPEEKLE